MKPVRGDPFKGQDIDLSKNEAQNPIEHFEAADTDAGEGDAEPKSKGGERKPRISYEEQLKKWLQRGS